MSGQSGAKNIGIRSVLIKKTSQKRGILLTQIYLTSRINVWVYLPDICTFFSFQPRNNQIPTWILLCNTKKQEDPQQ